VRLIHERAVELAAVIVEPLCQGAAGMKMYGAGFLRAISEACRKTGVLLIVDEIAMGFYRTGARFAYEYAGIRPDIVCLGKALSAGTLPISAAAVDRAVYDAFSDSPRDNTFYHGHTYAGNPLAAAAANAALDLYREMDLTNLVSARGKRLAEALEHLGPAARHLGLIAAADVKDPESVRNKLLKAGILVRPLGNTVYIMPPFILTDGEWEELLSEFVASVEEEVIDPI
jgi:adenosylmethionine-8-amino-7-oxononanoate aminotransferase